MFDPPAVPLEGGTTLWSNDGGPQHSAGAQFETPSLYREPLPFLNYGPGPAA
jgi:hypothetical protein